MGDGRRNMTQRVVVGCLLVVSSCSSDTDEGAPRTTVGEVTTTSSGVTTTTTPITSTTTPSAPVSTDPVPQPGSTYVVTPGDTLSGIASAHGVALAELVEVNGWTDGAAHPIFPGDAIGLPAGAVTASSDAPQPAVSTSPANGALGGYMRTAGLAFPWPEAGSTDPVVTPIPDGQYLAADIDVADRTLSFVLAQAHFGQVCENFPDEVDCMEVQDEPSLRIDVDAARLEVTVLSNDAPGFVSYEISGEELVRLLSGDAPAADAPIGFFLSPFPFVVIVHDGSIVAADQFVKS